MDTMKCFKCDFGMHQLIGRGEVWATWKGFDKRCMWDARFWYDWSLEEPWWYFDFDEVEIVLPWEE